jgi:hypothetical protein
VEGADFVHTDDADGAPYPRDVLDAESGGQIGYVVELELDIALLVLGLLDVEVVTDHFSIH